LDGAEDPPVEGVGDDLAGDGVTDLSDLVPASLPPDEESLPPEEESLPPEEESLPPESLLPESLPAASLPPDDESLPPDPESFEAAVDDSPGTEADASLDPPDLLSVL